MAPIFGAIVLGGRMKNKKLAKKLLLILAIFAIFGIAVSVFYFSSGDNETGLKMLGLAAIGLFCIFGAYKSL